MLGKDQFRHLYQTELELEAEWLRRGAIQKVNSIELLLKRHSIKPATIVELGCGVGAVLVECKRRGLARRYKGVDYAPEAIDYLRKHSEGIELVVGDITDSASYSGRPVDVVILSHVLEHLEEPGSVLRAIRQSWRPSYAVIEVPLEDLVASRLKSLVRERRNNKAAHVQFFTVRSFEQLVSSSGFRIIDTRTYVPILDLETVRLLSHKDGMARHRHLLKVCTATCLPRLLRPIWQRLYYAHHAVLCTPEVLPADR